MCALPFFFVFFSCLCVHFNILYTFLLFSIFLKCYSNVDEVRWNFGRLLWVVDTGESVEQRHRWRRWGRRQREGAATRSGAGGPDALQLRLLSLHIRVGLLLHFDAHDQLEYCEIRQRRQYRHNAHSRSQRRRRVGENCQFMACYFIIRVELGTHTHTLFISLSPLSLPLSIFLYIFLLKNCFHFIF